MVWVISKGREVVILDGDKRSSAERKRVGLYPVEFHSFTAEQMRRMTDVIVIDDSEVETYARMAEDAARVKSNGTSQRSVHLLQKCLRLGIVKGTHSAQQISYIMRRRGLVVPDESDIPRIVFEAGYGQPKPGRSSVATIAETSIPDVEGDVEPDYDDADEIVVD